MTNAAIDCKIRALLSRLRLDGLSAELAAGGGGGDIAEALRTGFRDGLRGGRVELLQEILRGQHEEEVDDSGDEQEIDDCGEEDAILDFAAVDIGYEVVEVGLADEGAEERIDDVGGKGRDDGSEGRSDDDGDGKIHNVATQNEITKSFEHEYLLKKQDRCING
jgi:hypothetical protein